MKARTACLILAAILLPLGCASLRQAERLHRKGDYTGEIAVLNKLLSAGDGAVERPAILLKRGQADVAAAQKMREDAMAKNAVWGVFTWPPESQAYASFYARAKEDFDEILTRYPAAPEAAEAQYLLGLIYDYPHLSSFEDALEGYQRTIDNYPGTEAARKAGERKTVIKNIQEGVKGSPHGQKP